MLFFFQHFIIFLQIFFLCLFLIISGFLLKFFLLDLHDTDNYAENGLIGFVLIGFISLSINFFYPLNILTNNISFLIIFLLGIKYNFFKLNIRKLFKRIFLISILPFCYLIYSNVNTPDAFLYHLPYSKIINEDKIIIGLTNLHSRFGHISIFQYISSFFVNSIFGINGILIPVTLVPVFFFLFCYKKFKEYYKKDKTRLNSYLIFLILIISIYSFSRYSGWGNDAQVHIYYFLSTIFFLQIITDQNNSILFYKLLIFSIFTFFMKPFYLITMFMPLIFFIKSPEKIKILKSNVTIFLLLFFILWLTKNFLVSSCLLYPINFTCFENISWYNPNTSQIAFEGEIWAKDWVNNKNNSIGLSVYLQNFNWVETWFNHHFKIILEKISPVIIFLLINIFIFFFKETLIKKSLKDINFFMIALLLINFLGCLIWFLKFPIFRYGLSYLYSLIIFIFYFILFRNIQWNKSASLFSLFLAIIYLGLFGVLTKNIIRIYKTKNTSVLPLIYDKNLNGEVVKYFNNEGVFIHYKNPYGLCGYSKSPCTLIDTNIKKEEKFGYTIFKKINR